MARIRKRSGTNSSKFERRMKGHARRKGIRSGSREYNRYVYGTMSRRMASKHRKRGR